MAAAVFFVGVTLSPLRSGFADAPDRGPGDVGLYRAEADRIRAGEAYYDAIATELRQRGYPTRSVFNWRTPLPVWLIGKLPANAGGDLLLGGLGLVLIGLTFHLLANEGSLATAGLGVLLLSGALLPCVLGELSVMSELWSGVLIALSAVLFGLKRNTAAVLAGLAALFFRELAAPYCLLCIVLATGERRWRELAQWGTGLAAYAVFYAWHVSQVLPRIGADDLAHAEGWLRLAGAGFLISTAQMNIYLLLLPQWVAAVYLAATLVACACWNTPAGRRISLTIVGYSVGFSLVGNDFNQYWGSLTAPLMCLAAARFPATLRSLWHDADWSALFRRAAAMPS